MAKEFKAVVLESGKTVNMTGTPIAEKKHYVSYMRPTVCLNLLAELQEKSGIVIESNEDFIIALTKALGLKKEYDPTCLKSSIKPEVAAADIKPVDMNISEEDTKYLALIDAAVALGKGFDDIEKAMILKIPDMTKEKAQRLFQIRLAKKQIVSLF